MINDLYRRRGMGPGGGVALRIEGKGEGVWEDERDRRGGLGGFRGVRGIRIIIFILLENVFGDWWYKN